MKKLLVALLVAVLCAPAMAATTVSCAGGEGVMTITVNVDGAIADEEVRGLAVTVSPADAGDAEIALDGLDFDVTVDGFNTFIDYAYSEGAGYTAVGQGHPIAVVDAAGAIDPAAGVHEFAVSAGFLDEAEGQAGLGMGTYVITINMTGTAGTSTLFDVALDTLRGGIVGDELAVTDSLGQVTVTIPGAEECVKSTASFYQEWLDWGSPACWCFERQCRGDANGAKLGPYWVQTTDLNAFVASYFKLDTVLATVNVGGVDGICCDFNHAKLGPYRVQTADLNEFVKYYFKIETLVPVCPADDYNFWVTP